MIVFQRINFDIMNQGMDESPIVKQQFNIVFKGLLKASLNQVIEYIFLNKLLKIQGAKSSANPREVP